MLRRNLQKPNFKAFTRNTFNQETHFLKNYLLVQYFKDFKGASGKIKHFFKIVKYVVLYLVTKKKLKKPNLIEPEELAKNKLNWVLM